MLDILKTITPSAEQWEIVVEGARNSFNSCEKVGGKDVYSFAKGVSDVENIDDTVYINF